MESLGSYWQDPSSMVMNPSIPASAPLWTNNNDDINYQHQSAAATHMFHPVDQLETNQFLMQMVQQLAPNTALLDTISAAAGHGKCGSWNDNNNVAPDLVSPSSLINQIIPLLPPNFTSNNNDDHGDQPRNIQDSIFDVGGGNGYNSSGSIDHSLECLLSVATSHNTDNSMEDDGISMILSDCRKNLRSNPTAGIAPAAAASVINSSAPLVRENQHNATRKYDRNIIAADHGRVNSANTTNTAVHVKEVHHQADPHQQPMKKQRSTKRRRDHHQLRDTTTSYDHHLLQESLSLNNEAGNDRGSFKLIIGENNNNHPTTSNPLNKKHKFGGSSSSSNISFQQPTANNNNGSTSTASLSMEEPDAEAIQQMKEMIYRAAAFRPVNLGLEIVDKPKRKNVKISSDPQTVAARQRREKISERLRVLQKLVPGGTKMDTASMLDEAANYLKFLRSQVKALESLGTSSSSKNINGIDHDHNSSSSTPNTNFSHPTPINFHFSNPFPMQSQVHHLQNPN